MKKKVMILGAGIFQVPLIRKARELGLQTLVVSPVGNYPGIGLADIFIESDTTDKEKVLAMAMQYNIDAIVTTGTDVSIPTLAFVANRMGLKGPDPEVAETVTFKTGFRRFQQKRELTHPLFSRCTSREDALRFYRENNCKMVVKPDDASGSRGVSIVLPGNETAEVILAFDKALSFSRNKTVCAEEFVPGTEVGGDAFLQDGKVAFITTTKKYMDGLIVKGHSIPGVLGSSDMQRVKIELENTTRALGYKDGPVNFDVIITQNRVVILEMGLRNGGNGITDIVYHAIGVDLVEVQLQYALGMIPEINPKMSEKYSSYVFGGPGRGVFKSITPYEKIKEEIPEVCQMILAKKTGDIVETFEHNANLIGYLIINAGAEKYREICSKLEKVLKIDVK